eukprot:Sspe_Gene.21391::Locus_8014_Transcript_1_1_Confidence_1.000_Length_4713::g.21391::m.21391
MRRSRWQSVLVVVLAVCGGASGAACWGGPRSGADPNAVYTACSQKASGELCVPRCVAGYHASGPFRLECVAGEYDASGATCVPVIDECSEVCETCEKGLCTAAGQKCFDGPGLYDWECRCPSPAVGSAPTSVATCRYQECSATTCPVGSTCREGRLEVDGDCTCDCNYPATGSSPCGTPPVCRLNECTLYQHICSAAGQMCRDTDHQTNGTWRCYCLAPASGWQEQGVAHCTGYTPPCTETSCPKQVCTPTASTSFNCSCIPPARGPPRQGLPAICVLDECRETCPTCANKVCERAGQVCKEGNTHPESLGDWSCECPMGETARGAPVPNCKVNECEGVACPVRRTCSDSDLTSLSGCHLEPSPPCPQECIAKGFGCNAQGVCACPFPYTGPLPPIALADCALDECELREGCPSGQTCVDPDTTKSGDWECRCTAPFEGRAVGRAATCTLDECKGKCAGQLCVDPSPITVGDWECHCVAPATGSRKKGAATCSYPGVCAEKASVCTAAGQACIDKPNKAWACLCTPPLSGSRVGGVADCELNECDSVDCGSWQHCVDPNTSPGSLGDWECHCSYPKEGKRAGGPAECTLDECRLYGETCHAVGQACTDTNRSTASLGTWLCRCVQPAVGHKMGGTADCTFQGKCVTDSALCTTSGQTCSGTADSVTCSCVTPFEGKPRVGGPTECTVDECSALCPTCEMGRVCGKGQICRDPELHHLGDWECVCAQGKGSALGRRATCIVDECALDANPCRAAGQHCVDTNTSSASLDDWECRCIPPASGVGFRAPAACTHPSPLCQHDMCKGQACVEEGGTWWCKCAQPYTGSPQKEGRATCYLDECTATCPSCARTEVGTRSVCTAAGQGCVDPDKTKLGDWRCICLDPFTGEQVQGKANCLLDECATEGKTCKAAGQLCHDPDLSWKGNWECQCPGGGGARKMLGAVPQCYNTGLCAQHGQKCREAGQGCVENGGVWSCTCLPPEKGKARSGAPADCKVDCLGLSLGECGTAGVWCQWSSERGECVPRCSQYVGECERACRVDPFFRSCESAMCLTQRDRATCHSTPGCVWSDTWQECIGGACTVKEREACGGACEWKGTGCAGLPGCGHLNHTMCDDVMGCQWKGGRCAEDCSLPEDDCRAAKGVCVWSGKGCVRSTCTRYTQSLCNGECEWVGDHCEERCEGSNCTAPSCSWSPVGCGRSVACRGVSQSTCDATAGCTWRVGRCSPSPCSPAPAQCSLYDTTRCVCTACAPPHILTPSYSCSPPPSDDDGGISGAWILVIVALSLIAVLCILLAFAALRFLRSTRDNSRLDSPTSNNSHYVPILDPSDKIFEDLPDVISIVGGPFPGVFSPRTERVNDADTWMGPDGRMICSTSDGRWAIGATMHNGKVDYSGAVLSEKHLDRGVQEMTDWRSPEGEAVECMVTGQVPDAPSYPLALKTPVGTSSANPLEATARSDTSFAWKGSPVSKSGPPPTMVVNGVTVPDIYVPRQGKGSTGGSESPPRRRARNNLPSLTGEARDGSNDPGGVTV